MGHKKLYIRRLVLWIILLFSSLYVSSQNLLNNFEKEWKTLKAIESKDGIKSFTYADQLTYMAYEFQDTTYHDYPAYTGSYSRSLSTVKNLLSTYNGVDMILDIHRDALRK